MPYDNTTGVFTLLNSYGTGTSNDNNFPNSIGLTLNDVASSITISGIIATTPFQQNVVQPGRTNTITVGYLITPYNAGTLSSGTFTPDATLGNYQYLTNNGAFTWAAPAADSAIDTLVTNGASAGAITFSGFTIASGNTGDSLTTTNGNKFIVTVIRINGISTYVIKALQ